MPHQLIHNHYVTCGTSTHENNYFVPKLIRLFQVYIWIQLRKVIYSELLQENYFMNYVLSSPAKDCLLAIKPDSRFLANITLTWIISERDQKKNSV
jgi:hypothetical protein